MTTGTSSPLRYASYLVVIGALAAVASKDNLGGIMRKRIRIARYFSLVTAAIAIVLGTSTLNVISQSPIVNFVHAGGSDIEDPDIPGSGPGFDKNYSLTAFKFADGTATGKLIDRYSGGGLGLKGDIDCVHVVGNTAWLSGIITQGQTLDVDGNPVDITGYYVRTRVQDNGDNTDPTNPDRVAFTQFRSSAPFPCANMFMSTFWDMPGGQVTVR